MAEQKKSEEKQHNRNIFQWTFENISVTRTNHKSKLILQMILICSEEPHALIGHVGFCRGAWAVTPLFTQEKKDLRVIKDHHAN